MQIDRIDKGNITERLEYYRRTERPLKIEVLMHQSFHATNKLIAKRWLTFCREMALLPRRFGPSLVHTSWDS